MKDELKELLLNNVSEDETFTDCHELYEHLDYSGGVHEIIESNIDIYYYDLRKWAVDNYQYIEQALEEGLAEGVTDFHALITWGQFVQLTEQARDYIEELFNEYGNKLFKVVTSSPVAQGWHEIGCSRTEIEKHLNK